MARGGDVGRGRSARRPLLRAVVPVVAVLCSFVAPDARGMQPARTRRGQTGRAQRTSASATAARNVARSSGCSRRNAQAGALPLSALHRRQLVTRFPSDWSPPRMRGSTWSSVRSADGCASPQYTQR